MLVTGAGGFIGSHVAGRLVEEGAEVRVLLRYTSDPGLGALEHDPRTDELDVRRGDLRDPDAVDDACAGCDSLLHLGALVAIPYSYAAPRAFVETNVLGTLNVLNAARRHGPRGLVCLSTSEVYGTPERVPIREGDPLSPQSPYAASKVGADALALSYHRSFGVPVVLARPFNTYGPRQSARAVIPTILSQALSEGPVRLGSLEPVRDLTYVADMVEGLLALGATDHLAGRTIHFGSGQAVSIAELVTLTETVLGRELEIRVDEQRIRPADSEVARLVCDAQVARAELGWSPRVSLSDGLASTARWIEANLDGYRPRVYAV